MSEFDDAVEVGTNTLHGAIDYWQDKASKLQAEIAALREQLAAKDEALRKIIALRDHDAHAGEIMYLMYKTARAARGKEE